MIGGQMPSSLFLSSGGCLFGIPYWQTLDIFAVICILCAEAVAIDHTKQETVFHNAVICMQ